MTSNEPGRDQKTCPSWSTIAIAGSRLWVMPSSPLYGCRSGTQISVSALPNDDAAKKCVFVIPS